MTAQIGIPVDASTEQLRIIIGTLYLGLARAIEHISRTESPSSVDGFKDHFLTALKRGDIDMSLLDDAKTFDLVVSIVEGAMGTNDAAATDASQPLTSRSGGEGIKYRRNISLVAGLV